jgi:hypothetical protein
VIAQRLTLLIPIVRDVVFLAVGTYVFVAEARADARWGPMLLGMLFAAGPTVVSAYWSTGRTPDSGSPASPASPSPAPLPSTSSSVGER